MKKRTIDTIEEYCTGCGLCHSICNTYLERDKKGFYFPKIQTRQEEQFCIKVCPAMNNSSNYSTPWGNGEVWQGWSNSESIRFHGSSGGVITALCLYLLESGKVDGILEIGASKERPWQTEMYCNISRDEVLNCSGSRYAASSPLLTIKKYLESDLKYALVGRPCDIVALKNYERQNSKVHERISYTLSFFCAGTPSEDAQGKLLENLHCSFDNCKKLVYRGDGWPGFATAEDDKGIQNRMSYNESWGKILGRDIRKVCRVCIDAVGEQADIACGDAWYLNEKGEPDFSEHDGRNVVFGRTEKGKGLLKEAVDSGYIVLDKFNIDELKSIQKFQLERRSTMGAKIIALKAMGKNSPRYSWRKVMRFANYASFKEQYKWFRGSISRIRQGKF